jgi:hypothetical protein
MAAALLVAALVAMLCSVSCASDSGLGSAVYASNGVVVVEGLFALFVCIVLLRLFD